MDRFDSKKAISSDFRAAEVERGVLDYAKPIEESFSQQSFQKVPSTFSISYQESIYNSPGNQQDRSLKVHILEAVHDPLVRMLGIFERHDEARYAEVNELVKTGQFTHVLFESQETQQKLIDEYMVSGEEPYSRKVNAVYENKVSLSFIFEYNKTADRPVVPVACDVDYMVQEAWEQELRATGLLWDEIMPLVAERRDREIVAPKILEILKSDPTAKVLILRGRGHEPFLIPLVQAGLAMMHSDDLPLAGA
jgi:hypothetical protein